MKETRIDFPDYTAENQERDAERYKERQRKDVYIVKISGKYGAYFPTEDFGMHSKDKEDFTSFIKRVEKFSVEKLEIKPKLHCVLNEGIQKHIQKQITVQKLIKEKS